MTRSEFLEQLRRLRSRIHEDRVTAEDDEALGAIRTLFNYLTDEMTEGDFPLDPAPHEPATED